MGRTRTAGITTDGDGNRIVAKQFKGRTIFARLGQVSQEFAEEFLGRELARIRAEVQLGRRPRRVFAAAAQRYLTDAAQRGVRSLDDLAWHVSMLLPYLGTVELQRIHNGTLDTFRAKRRADGVSATTINRSLEVARTILNAAARLYRDDEGRPWLETAPLIVMEKEHRRQPRPITWDEQARLLPPMPAHLARMVLFALNTGAREEEVCGLRWEWERPVEGTDIRVFVVPRDVAKNGRERVLVLNDVARNVVDEVRGQHADWVFVYRRTAKDGKAGPAERVARMNNTAWRRARRLAGLDVHVHDLRHTFGRRLRAAGVNEEDRADLLGHYRGSMTTHYSAAEIGNLVAAANRVNQTRAGGVVQSASLAEVLREKRKAG
jgi:integrase